MSWDNKTLGDIYDLEGGKVQTGPFGSQLHESDYKEFGIPVIMPKDIKNDKLDYSSIARISKKDANRLSQHIVKQDDVVFPRRGEIDKRVLISDDSSGAFCGTGCIRLRGTGEILNAKFLFYYLKQKTIVKWIENQAIGATMMNLNTSILRSIPIHYPKSITSQKKIASILSAYDDLIENNNQRIKLLEEMAEDIYKEWFVRMRFPATENSPSYKDSKFFDKEGNEVGHGTVGALPEGWDVKMCKEFCSFPYGKMPEDKNELITEEFPYEIQSGHGCKGFSSKFNISKPSIIITVRGSVGRVEILYDKCWITNLAVIVKYKKAVKSIHFLFHELKAKKLELLNTGSAIPQITSGDLGFVKTLIPNEDLQEKFEAIVSLIYQKIQILKSKNQVLQETRDLLLPRLISGKLSVEGLEMEGEESVLMAAEPAVEYK